MSLGTIARLPAQVHQFPSSCETGPGEKPQTSLRPMWLAFGECSVVLFSWDHLIIKNLVSQLLDQRKKPRERNVGENAHASVPVTHLVLEPSCQGQKSDSSDCRLGGGWGGTSGKGSYGQCWRKALSWPQGRQLC